MVGRSPTRPLEPGEKALLTENSFSETREGQMFLAGEITGTKTMTMPELAGIHITRRILAQVDEGGQRES